MVNEKLGTIGVFDIVQIVDVFKCIVAYGKSVRSGFTLCFRFFHRNSGKRIVHSFQNVHKSLTAAVHDACFGKDRQKFGSVRKRFIPFIEYFFKKFDKIGRSVGDLYGKCADHSYDGQNRSFFRIRNRLVRFARAVLKRLCKSFGVDHLGFRQNETHPFQNLT